MCHVDFSMRQCSGVRLSTDRLITDGKFTTVQVAKFDKVGDFAYMVYAERALKTIPNTEGRKTSELEATLQIYSPRHPGPMYQVELPMYNAESREPFWVSVCLRGGRGINYDGLTVADPNALYLEKPNVNS